MNADSPQVQCNFQRFAVFCSFLKRNTLCCSVCRFDKALYTCSRSHWMCVHSSTCGNGEVHSKVLCHIRNQSLIYARCRSREGTLHAAEVCEQRLCDTDVTLSLDADFSVCAWVDDDIRAAHTHEFSEYHVAGDS